MSIRRPAIPTDAQLAERLSNGCTESFGLLVDRLRPRLRGYLLGRWASRADVDDLVGEAIARAFENRQQYRPSHPFVTWLFAVARHVAIDHYRKHARHGPPICLDDQVADPHPGPEARLINRDTHDNLWSIAHRRLKPGQFEVLWLRYVEQMSIRQISCVVGRSSVTIKVWLFRARRSLAPHVAHLQSPAQPTGRCLSHETTDGGAA